MSARIIVHKKDKPSVRFQLLPFSLHHDGPAHVSQFFESTVVGPPHQLQASFRGRPLRGHEVRVPGGFTGLVLRAKEGASQQTFEPTGSFKTLISWKWDQDPDSDSLSEAFDWTEVSAAVHSTPPKSSK